jgi:hypothetical protein
MSPVGISRRTDTLVVMAAGQGASEKAERRAARALVVTYHEAELAGLIGHVEEALERFGAGELDAYGVDEVLHHYSKAARELWKFCFAGGSGAHLKIVALIIERESASGERRDWWEAVERRHR